MCKANTSEAPMRSIALAHRYFDAWNRHDAAAVAASFAPDGTYTDPTAGPGLKPEATAAYAAALFAAFPDLIFDLDAIHAVDDRAVVGRWVMRGTQTGTLRDIPPTGRRVALPGVDVLTVASERVASVVGYFDRQTLLEQLGLHVIAQPLTAGPFAFGTSVHVKSSNTARPGAFSLTALRARSEEEVAQVRSYSRRIMQELPGMKGFLGSVAAAVDGGMYTVTAWEHPDDARQLGDLPIHREAMSRFFESEFTQGGFISVWTPHELRPLWVRCGVCHHLSEVDGRTDTCSCGAMLPERAAYW